MNKVQILILVCLLSAFSIAGQEIDKIPVIVTSGNAEIFIEPDEVTISLNVTKASKDLQTAKRENDAAAAKIIKVTKKYAIEPKDVKTNRISVEMMYEYVQEKNKKILDEYGDEVGRKIFKGYEVSKNIVIRMREISRFEEAFADLLNTGLSEVGSVTFETSKLREVKDKAREMAMQAAREKAVSMAGAVGQTVGKAVKIVEGVVGSKFIAGGVASNTTANYRSLVGNVSESVASFGPGAITVSADVNVHFFLN